MNNFSFIPLVHAAPEEAVETATGTAEEGGAHSGISVEPAVIGFQALNFVILAVVLTAILYKPLVKLMADRAQKIKEGIENAEKADGMLKESNQIRHDMLKRTQAETQDMMEKARKSGEEVKTTIVQEAHAEADKIVKAGHNAIEMEKSKAVEELKAMTVPLIIKTAEKLLREKLDASKDAQLIEQALKTYS